MATTEQIAKGIVQIGNQRQDAINSGDTDLAQKLLEKLRVLNKAFTASKQESSEAPSESVNAQAEATEFLFRGDYKVRDDPGYTGEFADSMTSGEKLAIEQPIIRRKMSEATDIPESQIDITSGLPGLPRARMGAMRDDSQVFQFLVDNYGQGGGDVREIPMEGKTEFLVMNPEKTNGQYVLADEYAPSLKDILDVSREVVVTGAEVTSAAVGPGKASIPITAGKAGLGVILANLGLDTLFGSDPVAEGKIGRSIGKATLEGGEAALIDLGIGTTLKGVVRVTEGKPLKTVDEQAAALRQGKEELEKRHNVNFPETYATRQGTMEALDEQEKTVSRYSKGFLAGLSRRVERARDIVFELSENLTDLSKRSFSDIYNDFRLSEVARNQETVNEIAAVDQQIGQAIKNAIESRINRLSTGSSVSLNETGNLVRNARNQAYDSAKNASDEIYFDIERLANERGVAINAQEVGNRIENVINSLDLPKDIKGEVLNIFKPQGLNKVSRQAGALGEQITEDLPIIYGAGGDIAAGGQISESAIQDLSFKQLDTFRKQINNIIDRQINQGKDVSDLIKIQGTVQGLVDEALAKGGDDLVSASNSAKEFFKQNILPFRAKGVADLAKTGKGGEYTLSGKEIVNKYFNGPRALENLRELKRIIGKNNPSLGNLRQAYFNELMSKGQTYDGSIDYLKLKQVAFDPDIVKELFGVTALKGFRDLDGLMKLNNATKLDEGIVKEMTQAKSPQDIQKILDLTRENIRRNNSINRNGNKLIDLIRSGDVSMENPADLIVALRGRSAGEASEFINALPETGGIRQSFRQEYLNDLMTDAGRGSSTAQKTSRKRGGRDIWDYNLMDKILRNKKQRANAEAVLGKNIVKDLERLNGTLKMYSRTQATQSRLFGVIRGQARQNQADANRAGLLTGTVIGSYDYVRLRILSAALSTDILPKILSKSKSEDEMFEKLLPALLATGNGVEALVYEADKDPRILSLVGKYINANTEPNK
jgi:hypothetical protein